MKNQNTKQTALANLTAEGFTAAITTSGLVVSGPGWKANFTDAGQDHDTFEGTVPSRVHDLATWDDETTRTRTSKITNNTHIVTLHGEPVTQIRTDSTGKAEVITGAREDAIPYTEAESAEVVAWIGSGADAEAI
jgi:hypothetical protein